MDALCLLDIAAQILVTVFGCTAIWLLGRPEKWSRWGFVCGMIAEPFWFYTLWFHGQYTVLVLSAWYFYSYMQGFYYRFMKEAKNA